MVRPRVLIDGITLSHPQPGGYKTYTLNLVRVLTTITAAYDFVVATDRPMPDSHGLGCEIAVLERTGSLGVVWREQVRLPRFARETGINLLHAPAATAPLRPHLPLVLTVYDAIEFTDPLPSPRQTKRWAMRVYSRIVQKAAAQRAAHIVTISDYSQRQLVAHLGIPPQRITVTHLAPAPHYHKLSAASAEATVRRDFGVINYVLGIASAAARKNTTGLLRAYASLPDELRRRHPLLLVCTHRGLRGRIEEAAAQCGLARTVVCAENVSDAQLLFLYNAASVFVFPSLEEGFGLPPLEAMACGAPVIAMNCSSLPEVLGDEALLVEPGNAAAMTAALACVLTDSSLATALAERGLQRAHEFSWTTTAARTIEIYQKVLEQC